VNAGGGSAAPRATATVLVIAGHDPSGGAGVLADREAVEAAGARAALVVATSTDQRAGKVVSFAPRPLRTFVREVRGARASMPGGVPGALKVGLIVDARALRVVAALARRLRDGGVPVVVDPVLAASGGERFLGPAAVGALLDDLLAAGVVLTPNVPEAAELTGLDARELAAHPAARIEAARRLIARGARAVVLKGGHGGEDPVADLLFAADGAGNDRVTWLAHPRLPGAGIRGSGCRFAAYLAAGLATGQTLAVAAGAAGRYVALRIQSAGARTSSASTAGGGLIDPRGLLE